MSASVGNIASRITKVNGEAVTTTVGDRAPIKPSSYFRWKGALDRAAAALLLIPALPIMALLILLVRLTSRGPGIYRQERVGKHGRWFRMYKIRSMRHDAEAGSGAVWAQGRDPRVTSLGRALRKLHLDELPQLFNVLKGEMSLVGPRPERPEFVCVLEDEIEHYRDRLLVPPGVTGLAQLNLPPDTDLNSVRRKLVLDVEYIQTGSLWLDLRILLFTFLRMLRLPLSLRLVGLKRNPPLLTEHAHDVSGGNGSTALPVTATSLLDQLAEDKVAQDQPADDSPPEPDGQLDAIDLAGDGHSPKPR